MTRAETRFGFVGPEMWGYPDWINQTHAALMRQKMTVRTTTLTRRRSK